MRKVEFGDLDIDRRPAALDARRGLLGSAGIEGGYRDTEEIYLSLEEFTAAGPREILVHPSDLDAARELLATDSSPDG